jgi:hypothetical protein
MNGNLFGAAIYSAYPAIMGLLSAPAQAQHDPGVRGGFENLQGNLNAKESQFRTRL